MVLRIRLQSLQVHLTMLQYYTCMQYTVRHNIIHTQKNPSTVKWAQWDKTQSTELLVPFICICSSLCTIVAHNTAQNRPDNFASCPPDNHRCSDDVYLRQRGAGDRKGAFHSSSVRVIVAVSWQRVIGTDERAARKMTNWTNQVTGKKTLVSLVLVRRFLDVQFRTKCAVQKFLSSSID